MLQNPLQLPPAVIVTKLHERREHAGTLESGSSKGSDKPVLNPAQEVSKHKHRCCPCPKWAELDTRAGFCTT